MLNGPMTLAQSIISRLRHVSSLELLQIMAECIQILTWRQQVSTMQSNAPSDGASDFDSDAFSSEHWTP